jgi:hypothetical protein
MYLQNFYRVFLCEANTYVCGSMRCTGNFLQLRIKNSIVPYMHIVPPAYGDFSLALVMHSNEGGPGPRHNMKEDPGTSTLITKREHGQEVPCDPRQVTRVLRCHSPPLPLPPIRAARAEPPPTPFWYLLYPLPKCQLRPASEENTLQPLVRGQRPWIGQEEDVEAILIFSAVL